jgi:hypothetical protein
LFEILSPDNAPIFLASLSNVPGGRVHHEFVRSEEELQKFIGDYNHPGRALYRTVAQLREPDEEWERNKWRCKNNVTDTVWIWGEVDFKHHPDIPPEEIRRRLLAMQPAATKVVHSGHGLHVYWRLAEREDASPGEGQRRIEEVLRLACAHIGGDPQVAETARLMRLVGSHNTRVSGEKLPVEIVHHAPEIMYDLGALEDAFLGEQPILPAAKPKQANGHTEFKASEWTGPIETETALAEMRFGSKDNSINKTQLKISAKLISAGHVVEQVVGRILRATQEAVKDDERTQGWDWNKEAAAIFDMCYRWINKRMKDEGEDLSHTLSDKLYTEWRERREKGLRPTVVYHPAMGWHVRGYPWERPEKKAQPLGAEATAKPQERAEKGRRIKLQPYTLPAFASIPRRAWLYGNHYMRRIVSATVGPGGIGKSSLGLVEAISVAIGRDLLGDEELTEPLRVWYHNGEDPREELDRRIAAICIHYSIDEQEVRERLFITCGLDMPIKVGRGSNEVIIDKALVAEIVFTIQEHEIDVGIFDPLVTLHNTNEILTATMDPIIREAFAFIANETNTSIELSHHTRKKATGQEEFTTADARGSSGIVDAVRAMRVTNQMSKEEANSFGINELDRFQFFRVSKGKANMTRGGVGRWYNFKSVILPNGDAEKGLPGDDVGVLTSWEPPDLNIVVTDEDRAFVRTLVAANPNLREDHQAKDWVGRLLAVHLNLNVDDKVDKARVKRVIQRMVDEGTLKVVKRADEKGRGKGYMAAGSPR